MGYVFNTLMVCLSDGFVYSLIGMGYFITFTTLDFPDLTVEGTVVTGGIVYAILVNAGIPPVIAMLAAFICGALAGSLTGILNVKAKISPLLSGILVMTGLISINLVLTVIGTHGGFDGMGGMTTIPCRQSIIFPFLPENVRKPVTFFIVAVSVKLIIDFYLKTKSGMALIATGNNARFTTMLAKNPGHYKILGLAIGNGLAALSGSIIAQSRQTANQSMGAGMVVIGLAAVIIGTSVFSKVNFMKPTTKVIIGAVIYQGCLAIATAIGIPSAYNKFIMAILFTAALIFSRYNSKKAGQTAK